MIRTKNKNNKMKNKIWNQNTKRLLKSFLSWKEGLKIKVWLKNEKLFGPPGLFAKNVGFLKRLSKTRNIEKRQTSKKEKNRNQSQRVLKTKLSENK